MNGLIHREDFKPTGIQRPEPRQPKTKQGECPHCETEQELALYDGTFVDYNRIVTDKDTGERRYAFKHRRLYICEQCAQESERGYWV